MKKIIIVFDGTQYSEGVFDFVVQLNALNPVFITGVFLSPMDYTSLWAYPLIPGSAGAYISMPTEAEKEDLKLKNNIQKFEEKCRHNDIQYKVHNDANGLVFNELHKETRFADLLILSSELFYKNVGEQPNDYMKEVLHSSECPVLLLPESFNFPQRIILSYDGSPSSVYAIKQFAYLFPELCNNKSILVYANAHENEIPDQVYMEELALRHFPDLTIQVIETNASKEFNTWVEGQNNPLVVTGAYSRPGISQLFKKSFLTEIIRKHLTPVFIAHK